MAYYTQTYTTSFIERLLSSAANLFDRLAARYAYGRIYRATMQELTALSDRDLADLGMHRSMLKGVALAAAKEKITL
ncbi:MAG: DUF1127 domain-containing protein [Roseobacter sp.]